MSMFLSAVNKLFRLFVFLMLVFLLCRAVFLLSFFGELSSISSFIQPLYHALILDVSTACYLLMIPALLMAPGFFIKSKIPAMLTDSFVLVVALLYTLLAIAEITIYRELHMKLYYSMFAHVFDIGEIVRYITLPLLMGFLVIVTCVSFLLLFLYKKIVMVKKPVTQQTSIKNLLSGVLFLTVSVSLLAIGCRGGLQPIPINEGAVCFSKNQLENDAAINSLWSLGHSYIETRKAFVSNSYKVMDDDEAKAIVQSLYEVDKDSTTYLFKNEKPNVCFIILEGWHADVVKSLGGYNAVAPNFEKLISEGYFFNNIRSTGHISDQGIPGILSGYPALTFGSVINQTEKQVNIQCLGKSFLPLHYHTSFFFGGQLIYGGTRKYIYLNQFDRVMEQKDFPALSSGKYGIHDSLMIDVWRDSLNNFKSPFFSCLYTLSTHAPYDIPTYQAINFGGDEMNYLNSIAYADRQLGKLFEEIKTRPWYSNTVFVIVPDHGHHTPQNHEYDSEKHYHIPLLICGGGLKDEFRGKQNPILGSQTDIATTVLHQLNLPSKDYQWGKDLMNPFSKQFAFYTFNDGFGYLETGKEVLWNRKITGRDINTGADDREKAALQKKGAAYLQVLMQNFVEL